MFFSKVAPMGAEDMGIILGLKEEKKRTTTKTAYVTSFFPNGNSLVANLKPLLWEAFKGGLSTPTASSFLYSSLPHRQLPHYSLTASCPSTFSGSLQSL